MAIRTPGVRIGRLYDAMRTTGRIVALVRRRVERAIEAEELPQMEFELTATKRTVNYREESFLEFVVTKYDGGALVNSKGKLLPEAAETLEAVYQIAQEYNKVEEQTITKGVFLRLRFNLHCKYDDVLLEAAKAPRRRPG